MIELLKANWCEDGSRSVLVRITHWFKKDTVRVFVNTSANRNREDPLETKSDNPDWELAFNWFDSSGNGLHSYAGLFGHEYSHQIDRAWSNAVALGNLGELNGNSQGSGD